MTFGEAAAVVAAVTGVATVSLLVVWLVSVTRALTSLQHHVEELRREQRPAVRQVAPSAERLRAEVVDPPGQAGTTEVRPAPRLVAVALSEPVIKAAAFASGTARAVRSFRRT
jgi:heme exporter protein D